MGSTSSEGHRDWAVLVVHGNMPCRCVLQQCRRAHLARPWPSPCRGSPLTQGLWHCAQPVLSASCCLVPDPVAPSEHNEKMSWAYHPPFMHVDHAHVHVHVADLPVNARQDAVGLRPAATNTKEDSSSCTPFAAACSTCCCW